jgi:hypothetical protein
MSYKPLFGMPQELHERYGPGDDDEDLRYGPWAGICFDTRTHAHTCESGPLTLVRRRLQVRAAHQRGLAPHGGSAEPHARLQEQGEVV